MSLSKVAVVVVSAMLSLGSGFAAAAAGPRAGEVLAMGGQCFVLAGEDRAPLKIGDAVHVGDTLDVPQGAKLKVRLDDGSIIAAAPGSRITVETFATGGAEKRDAKIDLASGLLRAVVASVGEPQKFEVSTATGVAAVRGTDWFIEVHADNSTQVGVLEGAVALSSTATGKSVRIPARWGARVEGGRDPVPPRVWSSAEFDDVISRTDLQ
jgi:hypothetical protein